MGNASSVAKHGGRAILGFEWVTEPASAARKDEGQADGARRVGP